MRHLCSVKASFAFALLLCLTTTANAANVDTRFGFLSIGGSNASEDIYVYEQYKSSYFDGSTGRFVPGGTHVVWWVTENGRWINWGSILKSRIRSISVLGNGGNDRIEIDSDLDAFLEGGDGNDHLFGGDGDDIILADDGMWQIVEGGAGNDVLVAGPVFFSLGLFRPMTTMVGDEGNDTYIYRWSDYLYMDGAEGWGYEITPDFTHRSGEFQSLYQITE